MRQEQFRRAAVRLPVLSDEAIAAGDAVLIAAVDGAFAEAARRAGTLLACRPACTPCCTDPFPITRLDAWRLRRGLAALAERDPERAAAVVRRSEAGIADLEAGFPGDPVTGRLRDDDAQDRYYARHANAPCPLLDPGTGSCDLYEARPVSCRTFGPPVRFGREEPPPCALCFQGAAREEIERCRVEPDPAGVEDAILGALSSRDGEDWETLVAYALARHPPRG